MADQPTTFPAYTVLQRIDNAGHKTQYLNGDSLVDGAGWVLDASILNDGFTANPVISYWNDQGQKVDQQVFDMRQAEPGAKADGVSCMQSGANLILHIRYHVGDFNSRVIAVGLRNYLHPYPNGVQPMGAPGAFIADGNPPPPPPPPGGNMLTQEDIDHIMAAFNHLIGASTNDARTGIHDKSKQGTVEVVNEMHLLTEGMFNGGAGSSIVYQQLINTSYTGCLGALHEAGLYNAPEAHAAVQQALQAENPANPVAGAEQPHAGELGMTAQPEEGANE